MKSEIKKNLLKMNSYFISLSLGLTSFFLILNNNYKNFENNVQSQVQEELQRSVAQIEIEKKVHNYLDQYVNQSLLENPDFFREQFMPSLDSIIDDYSNKIKPEIKDYIKESIGNKAKKWLNERYD